MEDGKCRSTIFFPTTAESLLSVTIFISLLAGTISAVSLPGAIGGCSVTRNHLAIIGNVVPCNKTEVIEIKKTRLNIPTPRFLEAAASRIQQRAFPSSIRQTMNQSTNVVVNDHVWKFHLDDGREDYHQRWLDRCRELKLDV